MEPSQPNTIVVTSGNSSAIKPIVGGVLIVAGVYFGYRQYQKLRKNNAEKDLDTEAGQIALELKNIFDDTFPSPENYRRTALKINAGNKDDVYAIYKRLATRNLSDDIARLPTGTVVRAAKTEAINNKADGVIKISANEDIQFMVSKGSKVRFTNPKKAVTLYASTKGLIYDLSDPKFKPKTSYADRIKASVANRPEVLTVYATAIVPYEGVTLATGWERHIWPLVSTRKVFAFVRIGIKGKDGLKFLWVDARELSLAGSLKGIDLIS